MNIHQFREIQRPYGEIDIVESESATLPPAGVPRTDDMREMVEHFQSLGLIHRIPAAVQVGEVMLVHPSIGKQIREHCKQLSRDIKADMENKFMQAMFGVRL